MGYTHNCYIDFNPSYSEWCLHNCKECQYETMMQVCCQIYPHPVAGFRSCLMTVRMMHIGCMCVLMDELGMNMPVRVGCGAMI